MVIVHDGALIDRLTNAFATEHKKCAPAEKLL
jgi:hypothetical protein